MICDCHNDFCTVLKTEEFYDYLFLCKEQGVGIILASIFTTEFDKDIWQTIEGIANALKSIEINELKILLHIEDLGFIKTEADIDRLVLLRPFSCGLTWNFDNSIANKKGLTKLGKTVVKRLKKEHILVDLAHANKKTFYLASRIIKRNLFVSHTGLNIVCESTRNIDNKQVKKIIKSNGFVGFFLVSKFLGERGINAHIKLCEKLGGAKNMGIGTDYFGTRDIQKGCETYIDLSKKLHKEVLGKNFVEFLSRLP